MEDRFCGSFDQTQNGWMKKKRQAHRPTIPGGKQHTASRSKQRDARISKGQCCIQGEIEIGVPVAMITGTGVEDRDVDLSQLTTAIWKRNFPVLAIGAKSFCFLHNRLKQAL